MRSSTFFRALAPATRTLRFGFAVALLWTAAACATMGSGGAGADNVSVEVENNLVPGSPLTVYLVNRETNIRRLVGNVSPGRTVTLRASASGPSGQYVLVGRTAGGRDVVSTPFSLTGSGSSIHWDVQSGIALITDS